MKDNGKHLKSRIPKKDLILLFFSEFYEHMHFPGLDGN